MNSASRPCRNLAIVTLAAVFFLILSGCDGDYVVPITSTPTRKVDLRLVGNWVSKVGKEKMRVRRFDESNYIVSYDGDLYRAYHSDLNQTSFISAQEIDSAGRKYVYLAYKLSADGQSLELRAVDDKVVPRETSDSVSVQKLLRNNLHNAKLFGDEGRYVREK
jgi:hypothetical protein